MSNSIKEQYNHHNGHRERKKEQFLKSGIEHLPEHEAIEFLLYYAIPRGDTNYIAHQLIKKFGSLVEVINADYNELKEIKGIGNNAASLICFVRMFSKLYLQNMTKAELLELHNSTTLKKFCQTLFIGTTDEEFHCLFMTDNLKLIAHEKVSTGKLSEVGIPVRKITHSILKHNCSRLVIVHNHPAGTCLPSRVDIDSTNTVRDVFSKMEVELVDHVIIGRDGVLSMRESGYII